MAANDELPRGGMQSQDGLNVSVLITLPAAPGVSHVLTDWSLASVAPAGFGDYIKLSTSDGAYTNYILGRFNNPGAASDFITVSDTGLQIIASPGASMSIFTATAPPAGTSETLVIHWYDI